MSEQSPSQEKFIPLLPDFHDMVYDVHLKKVREWKEKHPGGKAVATFPVYVPHELIYAFGHLPVNIFGGGEDVSISHADAILGSFICSISKSTAEMIMSYKDFSDTIDGYVFPFICDVSRNLSGIFSRRIKKPIHMLHLAQNVESGYAVEFLKKEYERMMSTLFPGEKLDKEKLREAIKLYNENREWYEKIYRYRWEKPWNVPIEDIYLAMRAGSMMDVREHNDYLEKLLEKFKNNNRTKRDAIRVVVTGNFCEQPPLDIINLIEQVGCYVIDDDFMIGRRFLRKAVNDKSDDPVRELARSYIEDGTKLAIRFHTGEKGEHILERVREAKADGVIFLTAKFCEPALDDLVLMQQALQENDIPSVHIEFEERGSGYENIRLSLETFVESLLFD